MHRIRNYPRISRIIRVARSGVMTRQSREHLRRGGGNKPITLSALTEEIELGVVACLSYPKAIQVIDLV